MKGGKGFYIALCSTSTIHGTDTVTERILLVYHKTEELGLNYKRLKYIVELSLFRSRFLFLRIPCVYLVGIINLNCLKTCHGTPKLYFYKCFLVFVRQSKLDIWS